jgi:tetratricopeptide (TPR) repeat protein
MSKIKDLPLDKQQKLVDEIDNIANNSALSFNEKEQRLISFSHQYPNRCEPQFYLGRIYEKRNDFKKALEHYNQAEKLLNDDLLTAQIKRHLAPGDKTLSKEINFLKSERVRIYSNIGLCYASLDNKEQAFSYYNQALANDPNDENSLCSRAGVQGNRGNYKAALLDACDATRLQPDDLYAWFNLSIAHLKLGNHGKALSAASKVKQLAPTNQKLLAKILKLEKDITAAQKESDKQESSLQSSSSSSSSSSAPSQLDEIDIPSLKDSIAIRHQFDASCEQISRRTDIDFTKKVKLFNDLSTKHPMSPAPHFFLGLLYRLHNKPQQALEHYNQAEKLLIDELLIAQTASNAALQDEVLTKEVNSLKIHCATIYNNIGNSWEILGNKEQAISYYNQALASNPNYALALSNRAKTHIDRGNYKAALIDAYQAIFLQPSYAWAWLRCSNAHAKLGEYSKATLAVSKAKEFAPTDNVLLEEAAAKIEKFIAAGQERSKGQVQPAQQPPSSSSSSSSSSQPIAPQQSIAPKSTTLARSDDDPMTASFKEGEASKENLDAPLKAIEPQSSPTPYINRLHKERRQEKEQEKEQPQKPAKKSKSHTEKLNSDRVTRSNGKTRK